MRGWLGGVSFCILTSEGPETVQPGATAQPASSLSLPHINQQLRDEDCYHGKLSRKAAESLLVKDGDFLVRESATSPGQYVLSGLQGGQAKHLLLVDPEGKVLLTYHSLYRMLWLLWMIDRKPDIVKECSRLRVYFFLNPPTGAANPK